jgi:hypothetical protein
VGSSAHFAIEAETRDAALSAAAWIPAFYPQVQAARVEARIELQSSRHSHDELNAIWAAALANEALFIRGRDDRAAALEELAR